MLEKLFALNAHASSARTEMLAGMTTFLTMAYIIFVNPMFLSAAGMDHGAVFVATCLAAAIGCFIMGFYANLPVALAPGMGLNAFFTYTVVLDMNYSWQVALGCVFLSGVLFLIISLFRIREWLINAIPQTLKKAIAAGIGAFLAFIALKSAEIIVGNPDTFVSLGNVTAFTPMMAALGLLLIVALEKFKVPGGIMIAILTVAILGIVVGDNQYVGIVSMPPSLAPTFMQIDFAGALQLSMISVIFAFFFVDLFDTAGTLIGVTERAGLVKNNQIPNLKKALLADSTATIVGAGLGTSNTTSYVESVAGVSVGGKTGLTAVTVGVLFLLATFFSPLAAMIPAYATAGAIFYVSVLMMYSIADIDWKDMSEAVPAAIILLMMPLSFSIADGITMGFIAYTAIKLVTGGYRQISISMWVLTIILLARLIWL